MKKLRKEDNTKRNLSVFRLTIELVLTLISAGGQSSNSNKVSYSWGIYFDPTKPGIVQPDEKFPLPEEITLFENYPDPFNPQTTIQYALPEPMYVKLIIYNMLGQIVTILVDEMQEAGYKSVDFDAASLPSEVYFY